MDDAGAWRLERPWTLYLPTFNAEFGEGLREVRAPKVEDLARWVSRSYIPLSAQRRSERFARDAELQQRTSSLGNALCRFDTLRTELRRPSVRRAPLEAQLEARRAVLSCHLKHGLSLRVGREVEWREQLVYLHLVARRAEADGLRLCEQCGVVFAGRAHAVRCPASFLWQGNVFEARGCQKRPARIPLRPVVEGGHHLSYWIGRDLKPGYTARCTDCGRGFDSSSAVQQLCRNCGGTSGRVRRLRGGSALGRQRFRYVSAEGTLQGPLEVIVGRERVPLEVTGGVVETADAEIARALDKSVVNGQLRRAS